MKEEPFVSILTVTYNHKDYIGDCIRSILNLTYLNFELIVVDDCSTDNTYNIAKEFEQIDEKVKVYKNSENVGDYPNRKIAASYAKGKYLKYVDGDDIIYPHSLEIMVQAMEKYPNAGIGFSNYNKTWSRPFPIYLSPFESFTMHYFETPLFVQGLSASIVRRDVYEMVGGFSGRKYMGDTELNLKIAAKYPILIFQNDLVWWRIHPQQESVKQSLDLQISNIRHKLDIESLKSLDFQIRGNNQVAIKEIKRSYCRRLLGNFIYKKNFKHQLKVFLDSEYSIFDLIRSIL